MQFHLIFESRLCGVDRQKGFGQLKDGNQVEDIVAVPDVFLGL